MDEAVGRGHGGHWVLEDLVQLGKHEIGGDDDGLPLVAFGEKVKEDLPLLAGLLGVAELVADDRVVVLELGQHGVELELSLGCEELAYQLEGRNEQDLELVPGYPLMGDGRGKATFPASWQAEAKDVVAAVHKVGLENGRQLPTHLLGPPVQVERGEGFSLEQIRVLEQPADLVGQALGCFGLGEIPEELFVGPVLG